MKENIEISNLTELIKEIIDSKTIVFFFFKVII